MVLETGSRLPDATLLKIGDKGPEPVSLGERLKGRKVVLFALPGAFTGTCTTAHVPSFMRNMDALKARGVDAVICVSVNDPFVMKAWGETTGALAAGIEFLADADGSFTRSVGMDFTAPAAGFIGRSRRYALLAEDGIVTIFQPEEGPGVCDLSSGEAMLEAMDKEPA
ncbi:MAG: thiol peroxidase (atypical 2-Cys peroxiredoxin) [Rhodobacteraceae bacterium HLUCCA12]|nr:MAG: thiol peroxidase (atypical 2-Cys peroxiredoxin) [Rhodobacteraceae bacterium HLUCCA12]